MANKCLLSVLLMIPLLAFGGQVEIYFSLEDFHNEKPIAYKITSDEQGVTQSVAKKVREKEWKQVDYLASEAQFISHDINVVEKISINTSWVEKKRVDSYRLQALVFNFNSGSKNYEYFIELSKKDSELNRNEKRIVAWFNMLMEKERRKEVYDYTSQETSP